MTTGIDERLLLTIDKIVDEQKRAILNVLAYNCKDVSEGTYYLGILTVDLLKMLYSIISQNTSSQEAKAAFKVIMDTFLIPNGMSVQIHEFN